MRTTPIAAALIALAAVSVPPARSATLDQPTFAQDIAPIFYDNCVSCHRPGEIGPMPLRTYEEVRPWARSIARNVEARTMPPWHADPGYGPFSNDRSLTDQEIHTITRWVNAGAPEGNGTLPELQERPAEGWRLGEPDWILEFDPLEVPAEGPDQFKTIPITTGFEEDRWIEALEVLPGDRGVMHHFLLWQGTQDGNNPESLVGGWAAGADPTVTPKGTARLLKKGHPLLGDFHYHPNGTASTDRTRVGIHFADAVEKELVNLWVLNVGFEIPAGDANYEARSTHVFPQDVLIRSLTPHMHYRGKDFTYIATYPDGRQEELLKVSRYDFNWQTGYDFAEPLAIPAGTRIDCIAHWDNSTGNPHNPDSTRNVTWGNESTDEMLIGFVDFTVAEGVSPKPLHAVLLKLPDLATSHPGEVWRVDVPIQQGQGPQPTALHLPRQGPGGWYVAFATTVLPAPVHSIVWEGNSFTAVAAVPGQELQLSGTVDPENGELSVSIGAPQGGGEVRGEPAEKYLSPLASVPN